jgi:hypothetical protein
MFGAPTLLVGGRAGTWTTMVGAAGGGGRERRRTAETPPKTADAAIRA